MPNCAQKIWFEKLDTGSQYQRRLAMAGLEAHQRKCFWRFTTLSLKISFKAVLVTGGIAFSGLPARAEFSICNKSLDVLNVAVAYDEDGVFKTEGWWSVGANRCAEVIRTELLNRYIYVYAEDVFGQAATTGDQSMCVDTKRFVIKGNTDCPGRGFISAFFLEVDTLSQDRWTLFLTGSGSN